MPTVSIDKLQRKLLSKGGSTLSIEREAGLKRGTIHNILRGRSRKPYTRTIDAICAALDCSPEDILDPDNNTLANKVSHNAEILNLTLFHNCCRALDHKLEELEIDVYFDDYIDILRPVYNYSLENGLGEDADSNFVNWIVKKSLKLL